MCNSRCWFFLVFFGDVSAMSCLCLMSKAGSSCGLWPLFCGLLLSKQLSVSLVSLSLPPFYVSFPPSSSLVSSRLCFQEEKMEESWVSGTVAQLLFFLTLS